MGNRRMEAVHAIEVYVGERGYVCLRQEDAVGGTGDIVALLPWQVPVVCQWLQECAAEALGRADAEAAAVRLPGASLRVGTSSVDAPPA